MGQKRKKCEVLKFNDKKIISFHLSKMLQKPNNCVKFQNFLSMNKTIISHFVFKKKVTNKVLWTYAIVTSDDFFFEVLRSTSVDS